MAIPGRLRAQRPIPGKSVTSLKLPGSSGSYASAPDSASLSVLSDITMLVRYALDDHTPAGTTELLAKWNAGGGQRSYQFGVNTNGTLVMFVSVDGTTNTSTPSSVAPTIADGATIWGLASWRDSDNRLQFFTAPGGIANPAASDFTQLGTDVSLSSAGIFDSTAVLEVGSVNTGTAFNATGKFYRAMIYNGVFATSGFGGSLVFDVDFTKVKRTGTRTPTTLTEQSTNAATVTVNGAAWDWLKAS